MSGKRRQKKQTKTHRTHIDLHAPVQAVVEEKVVRHADPVRFHGVALAVVVVPHIALEKKNKTEQMRKVSMKGSPVLQLARGRCQDEQPLPVHLPAPKRTPRCGTGWLRRPLHIIEQLRLNCNSFLLFFLTRWRNVMTTEMTMITISRGSSEEKISIGTGDWLARLRLQLPERYTSFSAGLERQNTYHRSNSKLFSLFRATSPF